MRSKHAFLSTNQKQSQVIMTLASFRLGARAWARCSGTKIDVVQTCQCPKLSMFMIQLGKGLDYGEIGQKFELGASTACEKLNAAGHACQNTISGASARAWVQCPNLCIGHQQKATFRLAPGTVTKSERGLCILHVYLCMAPVACLTMFLLRVCSDYLHLTTVKNATLPLSYEL